jgi:uncharacterized protein YecE (DUF72 family)
MSEAAAIHIGTSGWHYAHWRGRFYPEGLPGEAMLAHYATQFSTVEINYSFYHLPQEQTLHGWRQTVSSRFVFAAKASRYITHMKKLRDTQEASQTVLSRLAILQANLGPVLFQLPPRWKFDAGRLEETLHQLPEGYRYAFEFRDRSWLNDRCYELLSARGIALCIHDLDGWASPSELTTDFVYLRLHGPPYADRRPYGPQALTPWAEAIASWSSGGRQVYCYLNNDMGGFAIQDAQTLRTIVERADSRASA